MGMKWYGWSPRRPKHTTTQLFYSIVTAPGNYSLDEIQQLRDNAEAISSALDIGQLLTLEGHIIPVETVDDANIREVDTSEDAVRRRLERLRQDLQDNPPDWMPGPDDPFPPGSFSA